MLQQRIRVDAPQRVDELFGLELLLELELTFELPQPHGAEPAHDGRARRAPERAETGRERRAGSRAADPAEDLGRDTPRQSPSGPEELLTLELGLPFALGLVLQLVFQR